MTPAKTTAANVPHIHHSSSTHAKPHINVTPLIDVLLVLLIIFMVVAPLKMARFLTQVPSPPQHEPPARADDNALIVTIKPDRSLMLNRTGDVGSIDDPGKLILMLADVFQQRRVNHDYAYELRDRVDLPDEVRVQKTVFIKAPRAMVYGDVTKVLDAVKGAGASPVGLQIDELD